MTEALYADHPAVYDALYADKDYDREVAFVADQFAERGNGGDAVLVVGCGTGEHSKRLVERGFDVTGVDPHPAMVERARGKSEASFHVDGLPDLSVGGTYDLVWLPGTVLDHLDRDAIEPSLAACVDVLVDDGLLVVDFMAGQPIPVEAGPQLSITTAPAGSYARLVQVHGLGDDRYRMDSLVFVPDGGWFADVHHLTIHGRAALRDAMRGLGLSVESYGWYEPDAATDTEGVLVGAA